MVAVLFVCLGNICRSPMAHGVLNHVIQERQLNGLIDQVDSCGTAAYHAGSDPDSRTMKTLKGHKIGLSHSARQLRKDDFTKYDYILAMDRSNLEDIKAVAPANSTATIKLFGDYGSGKLDRVVKDPYYGANNDGFDQAYLQCIEFSDGLIQHIQASSSQ